MASALAPSLPHLLTGEDIGALFVSVQKNLSPNPLRQKFFAASREEGSASQFSLAYFLSVQNFFNHQIHCRPPTTTAAKNFAAIELAEYLTRDAKKAASQEVEGNRFLEVMYKTSVFQFRVVVSFKESFQ